MSPELSADEPRPDLSARTQNNIIDMLGEVITRLERIEQRQIKTTAMVEEVEHQEQKQVTGSFGSSEIPESK